ncbi:hypothetical protein FGO68_gene3842 [Halteria grandinella]|uniref:Uncharacterized protein n=1 Tax=Halteria grandinella TaxID=5974 RepID=A0A8J8P5N7_HALGN|nr:hypothetical protein FGO68_gene3842 [Halteria grandinella]
MDHQQTFQNLTAPFSCTFQPTTAPTLPSLNLFAPSGQNNNHTNFPLFQQQQQSSPPSQFRPSALQNAQFTEKMQNMANETGDMFGQYQKRIGGMSLFEGFSNCRFKLDYLADQEGETEQRRGGGEDENLLISDKGLAKKHYSVTSDEARHKFITVWNSGTKTIKEKMIDRIT